MNLEPRPGRHKPLVNPCAASCVAVVLLLLQACVPSGARNVEAKKAAIQAVGDQRLARLEAQSKRSQALHQHFKSICPPHADKKSAPKTAATWGPLLALSNTQWITNYKGGKLSHEYADWPDTDCVLMGRVELNKAHALRGLEMHRFFFQPSKQPGKLQLTVLFQDGEYRYSTYATVELKVTPTALIIEDGNQVLLQLSETGSYEATFETRFWSAPESLARAFKRITPEELRAISKPYFEAIGKAYAESMQAEYDEAQKAVDRREDEEAARKRWEMFGAAMSGASKGFAEASATSRQREARRDASLSELDRDLRARDAPRNAATQKATSPAATGTPQTTAPPRSIATASAAPVAAAQAHTPADATAKKDPQQGQRGSATPKASGHTAYPEAIVACTRPDAEGRFSCDTPLSIGLKGGPKTLPQWSTPEKFIADTASCRSPRKLESATHLVWGCGMGATNNGDTMDRSAGVDVRGRNTYYCVAKESPCRRTTQ